MLFIIVPLYESNNYVEMFTLNQIKDAHSKVKSGADFPKYFQDLISLGVLKCNTYVMDGHTEYIGENDYILVSEAEYSVLQVSSEVSIDKFKHYLKIHQQGKTNYFTFCENSAETGIERWVVDIIAKTCTYYDKSGNSVLIENIPA